MGRIYYIDGYNVILQCPTLGAIAQRDLEGARARLFQHVVHFCTDTGHRAVLVFDGRNASSFPSSEIGSTGQVQVVYSKGSRTADAVIERMVYEARHQHVETVVVSADREIRELCSTLGALVIQPGTFLGWMHDAQRRLRSEYTQQTAPRQWYRMEDVLNERSVHRLHAIRRRLEGKS